MRPSQPTQVPPAAAQPARPVTLATQELRLAMTFTGGTSLAVWMGAVARELNLLVQASDDRGTAEPGRNAVNPTDNPVRELYRRLLELMDVQVTIDVMSGTSAGGINAALLGLANAKDRDLGPLREVWLSTGLEHLMRDPDEVTPVSLLAGDARLLPTLAAGITTIAGPDQMPANPRRTDVFIATTLLSPEQGRVSDDYGTQIADTNHLGLFHFDENALTADGVAAPLALAARSSSAIPGAFEPAFVPIGTTSSPRHPDMAGHIDTTRSRWAVDGALLASRPLGPLLQSIFDRGADRQVRRALLYVTGGNASTAVERADEQANPLSLPQALQRGLEARLNQSIGADLTAIKEHNDRTRAAGDTRLRLASLGARLAAGARLADADAWLVYQERQGDWLVAPLIAEVTRQLGALPGLPRTWTAALASSQDSGLRRLARTQLTRSWPTGPPEKAEAAAIDLGRPAFDTAKATLLHLFHLGYTLAATVEDRNSLVRLGTRLHSALPDARRTDLRAFVRTYLTEAAGSRPEAALDDVLKELASSLVEQEASADQLRTAWESVAQIGQDASALLSRLAATATATAQVTGSRKASGAELPSQRQRRTHAADELTTYLTYLNRHDWVRQLLDLQVAVRSVLPVLIEVEQPVELIQVTSDTRSLLAPSRATGRRKLTGFQAHGLGAFYKRSWRANDWMWGRLDGCGWLVHILLDPRRILTVMENDHVEPGERAAVFALRLQDALGTTPVPDELLAELAYLDQDLPVPVSLPELTLWAARVLQTFIGADELRSVATQMRSDPEGHLSARAKDWLADFDEARRTQVGWQRREALARLLDSCPVPDAKMQDELRNPLFLRTITRGAAVAMAATTGLKAPAALRPLLGTARAITRAAHVITDKTHGNRRTMTYLAAGLLVAGVLGMLTKTVWLGFPGAVLFGTGALLVALCVGRTVIAFVQIVVILAVGLLAAAPWLPWLSGHLFGWLISTGVPWLRDEKWAWPMFLLLAFLAPTTTLIDRVRRRNGTRVQNARTSPSQ